jgi:hypothetical protein
MWTKTVERRIPPPKQRTKPIRQTKKDFNKSFNNGKFNGEINTKLSVLQLWKELKREIHDGLFVFFNDVPRKSSLEPYKNIIS